MKESANQPVTLIVEYETMAREPMTFEAIRVLFR